MRARVSGPHHAASTQQQGAREREAELCCTHWTEKTVLERLKNTVQRERREARNEAQGVKKPPRAVPTELPAQFPARLAEFLQARTAAGTAEMPAIVSATGMVGVGACGDTSQGSRPWKWLSLSA